MGKPLAFVLAMPQRGLMAGVRAYRLLLSPWLGNSCRFDPTCSTYSLQALEIHGATVGTYMTFKRLMRCNPLCAGGHDPVPRPTSSLFASRLTGALHPAATLPSITPTDKTPS